MKEISITKGKVTIVDDEDFERLSKNKWFLLGRYVARNKPRSDNDGKQKPLMMHRFILGVEGKEVVDHIDGDPLNNRKSNLRICRQRENSRNRSVGLNSKSGYKGVHLVSRNRWRAYITYNYQRIHIGYFKEKRDAIIAYNKAAKKYFGSFAKENILCVE